MYIIFFKYFIIDTWQ